MGTEPIIAWSIMQADNKDKEPLMTRNLQPRYGLKWGRYEGSQGFKISTPRRSFVFMNLLGFLIGVTELAVL
jgi:hypothetical protein